MFFRSGGLEIKKLPGVMGGGARRRSGGAASTGRGAKTTKTADIASRTAEIVNASDPFAFGANAGALFDDIDGEVLAEDGSDEEEREVERERKSKLERGVSVFERLRREKAEAERKVQGEARAAAAAAPVAVVVEEEPVVVTEVPPSSSPRDAFDGPETDDEDQDQDQDDVRVVEPENVRPAEDLFDEVAGPSPNGKRTTREPITMSRGAKASKRSKTVETVDVDPPANRRRRESNAAASTQAKQTADPKPSKSVGQKKTKVSLKEFAGEDDDDAHGVLGGDGFDDLMPQSGAQLADIDEANYAMSGLVGVRDAKEKVRSACSLVNMLVDQRKRRLFGSYGLPIKLIGAAQDAALGSRPPRALKFGCAAIMYLASMDLKPPTSDILLTTKSANAIRALLRVVPDGASSNEDASQHLVKGENAVRNALRSLKFLPHEAKDAQTLALLVAHHTLKQEQDAVLASGKGPGSVDGEHTFRSKMTQQGALLETCNLVQDAVETLNRFGAACFAPTSNIDGPSTDECEIDELTAKAAKVTARLFRCSRVLECASFESSASCDVIATSSLRGGIPGDSTRVAKSSNGTAAANAPSSLRLMPVETGQFMASPPPKGAPVPVEAATAASPSPVAKSRIRGGITMTPPSTPPVASKHAGAVQDTANDSDVLLVSTGATPMSSPVPIGLLKSNKAEGLENSIQWLSDNGFQATPVKGGGGRGGNGAAIGGRTACRALVQALPTLAAAATASIVGAKKGDEVCGVRIAYDGGLTLDHRVAIGTLKSVLSVLTNVTNENLDGCRAIVGGGATEEDGLLVIASLVPWFALSVEGYTLRDVDDERTRTPTNDSGSQLLNAALVLLINMVEADAVGTTKKLRSAVVGLPAQRTQTSFVEMLAKLFLQSGGGAIVNDDNEEPEDGDDGKPQHVTADMIKSHTGDDSAGNDDLILQAYTGLLLAFLIEDHAALRAEVASIFGGSAPFQALADTLERFHAFHESVNSISAASSERLVKVVKWLR